MGKKHIVNDRWILSSRGQVWVETVIYTLIGLAVIGLLLGASKPKIEKMKDRAIIEQTIITINEISSKIYDVQIAPGNRRILDLKVAKGRFYINSSKDTIGWILDSAHKYSELGKEVSIGNLKIITKEGDPYNVEIYMNYSPVNITAGGAKNYVSYDSSPSPYRLSIENKGKLGNSKTNVDLKVD